MKIGGKLQIKEAYMWHNTMTIDTDCTATQEYESTIQNQCQMSDVLTPIDKHFMNTLTPSDTF